MPRTFAAGLISAALLVGALPFVSTALTSQDAPPAQPQTQPHPQRPMPKPTNLQVLPKDIASADLLAMMRGYTKALGVECGFCHAEDTTTHRLNFAADTKPDKTIARTMIAMTQEINTKYMSQVQDPDAKPADKTVTCATCHRGNSMPMVFVAPPGNEHHGTAPGAPEKKPE
jgi:hypothetical protein